MLNVAELANLPHNVSLYVIDNGGYASIRQSQEAWGLHQTGNEVNIPNLDVLTAAFGAQVTVLRVDKDEVFPPKWEFRHV
jgi:thiamine pyrophosphate-dependent acetolactate synthase large subunit-like protein